MSARRGAPASDSLHLDLADVFLSLGKLYHLSIKTAGSALSLI
jgi:hypothetical protein